MVKIGSFRIKYIDGRENYLEYTEFYERSESFRQKMKEAADNGDIKLSCACKDNTDLKLGITRNLVIRVAENKGQEQHMTSCPKSEVYKKWAAENTNGLIEINEDGTLCFNIVIPSGMPSKASDSRGSSESSSGNTSRGIKQRADILDLVSNVNSYAWNKQGYSIKKNIKICHQEGRKPDWRYKSLDEFNRLFFGVTSEIDVYWQQNYYKLKDLCYRADLFFQAEYRQKFLVYAKIEKMSDFKEDRKYQYITVCMRGNKSANKAVVRILTENVLQTEYDALKNEIESRNMILSGYARHDSFTGDDGKKSDWITMLNFVVVEVSDNGIILRHKYEKKLINALCQRRILFKKSLLPLSNYGWNKPTAIIEQLNGKDIIVDICKSGMEYSRKEKVIADNPEFEILLYKKNKTSAEEIVSDIFRIFEQKKH